MSDIAIRVHNLSKRYKIGVQRHDRLKDFLTSSLNGFFRRSSPSPLAPRPSPSGPRPSTLDPRPSDTIWALKDVSFDVKQGETLGIIGANGAGKSTLLKILSRITEPTSGRAEVYGRVGSLLEVGTGFHPELTGRENIYMNGAVLGMTKREIDRKFDEIVEFSGVEKFIDTPVKRYSSGMHVRLAFAVAAHLEPEILIVDEVLAVGDAEFQKRCLGKMGDVAHSGRTVLFVSHNMAAVASLCSRAVLLHGGQVVINGDCEQAIATYYRCPLDSLTNRKDGVAHAVLEIKPELDMQLLEVSIRNEAGEPLETDVPYEGRMTVEIKYEVRRPKPNAYVCFCFSDIIRGDSWWQYDADTPIFGHREKGIYVATIDVPPGFFGADRFHFRASIVEAGGETIDYRDALFRVTLGDTRSVLASKGVLWPSAVRYATGWTTKRIA